MNDAFIDELKVILASGFTGSITMHIEQGTVKMYEKNERRRPSAGRAVHIIEREAIDGRS